MSENEWSLDTPCDANIIRLANKAEVMVSQCWNRESKKESDPKYPLEVGRQRRYQQVLLAEVERSCQICSELDTRYGEGESFKEENRKLLKMLEDA